MIPDLLYSAWYDGSWCLASCLMLGVFAAIGWRVWRTARQELGRVTLPLSAFLLMLIAATEVGGTKTNSEANVSSARRAIVGINPDVTSEDGDEGDHYFAVTVANTNGYDAVFEALWSTNLLNWAEGWQWTVPDGNTNYNYSLAKHGCQCFYSIAEHQDSDVDGISDMYEQMLYMTDPENWDSDGDGLADGWEIQHGFDASLDDSESDRDNDGVSDYLEMVNGTDPEASDSDQDGLPLSLDPERDGLTSEIRSFTTRYTSGDGQFDLTAEINELIGGRITLRSMVYGLYSHDHVFSIRGRNPRDDEVTQYISAHVPSESARYAPWIAKHETIQGGRAYNQFNTGETLRGQPNRGGGNGWGVAQIDTQTEPSVGVVWNWHDNIDEMAQTLSLKIAAANNFIGYFRSQYGNLPNWREPDTQNFNLYERQITAKDWCVMTLYNGAGGIPFISVDGHRIRSPIVFNPRSGTWSLRSNSNDYVNRVLRDSNRGTVE